MSDYTQFTKQVRAAWAISRGDMAVDALVQFDRWLAEVKAAAWDECVEAVARARNYGSPGGLDALRYVATNNPYRTP